jgi:hypothetical protein
VDEIEQLEFQCQRNAAEFLALDWGTAEVKARTVVTEMLEGGKLFSVSMAWLLNESVKIPVQHRPIRKLHDLIVAISALRLRRNQVMFRSAHEAERGAAA